MKVLSFVQCVLIMFTSPPLFTPLLFPPKFVNLKRKTKLKTNLCYPNTHRCVIFWSAVYLSRASLLEKTDFLFSYANEGQLVLGWGRIVSPALIPMLEFGLAWPCTICTHAIMSLYVCFPAAVEDMSF